MGLLKSKGGALAVLFILIPFITYFHFYKLSDLPFRVWDEARLSTNAYEMTKTGNLIVTTSSYRADLIGTKPPLMIWAQAVCIKLISLTELAVRFPAAACSAFTILIVFLFVYKLTGSKWTALTSGIVLCTANCYLFDHATRYGEYDSMLTFFTTGSLISFYMYTETVNGKRDRYLLLFFFLLAMGVLTKGIAGLLFAPPLFIYLLLRKQLTSTILNKYLITGIFLFVIMVGAFYISREIKSAGYLQAVAIQELGGRFNEVIEGHGGPWSFYWDYLKCDGFGSWYWALPTSICIFWFFPNRKLARVVGFCLLASIGMLTAVSFSQTKLEWYVLPAIPLFAIIVSVLIDQMSGLLGGVLMWNKQIVIMIMVIIFSVQPTIEAINTLGDKKDDLTKDNFYAPSYYFRQAIDGKKDLRNYTYLCGGYDIQWKLYVFRLRDMGVNIQCIPFWDGPIFHKGDKVIANITDSKNYVENNYQYQLLEDFYGVRNYLITGYKGNGH
jgi:4-amino-4-deoxy-L-arabinose transferase-like glycosyltransferase